MRPYPSVDFTLALDAAAGPSGLARERVAAGTGALRAAHERIVRAASEGLLPHVNPGPDPAAGARLARGWLRGGTGLCVLGEPAAVAGARAIAQSPHVRWLDSPDPAEVDRALAPGAGGAPPRLIVLDGPSWVRTLAGSVADRARGAIIVADSASDDGWSLPPSSERKKPSRVVAPAATDPRFVPFGPVGLALAAVAGADPDALAAALGEVAGRCAAAAFHQNPAYVLAGLATVARQDRGLGRVAFLVPSPGLLPCAAWARAAWAACTSRSTDQGGIRVHEGGEPLVVQSGDEAMIQRLVDGPRDLLTVALWAEEPSADSMGLCRSMWEAHVRQLVGCGRPVVRVALRDAGAASVAGVCYVLLHAAIAAAARFDVDPLELPAADRWREILAADGEGEVEGAESPPRKKGAGEP